MIPRYDLSWTFSDGQIVTFRGIGTLADVRLQLKTLKRNPKLRDYAIRLTLKPFTVTVHAHCPDCAPCPTCRRSKHGCEGHEKQS